MERRSGGTTLSLFLLPDTKWPYCDIEVSGWGIVVLKRQRGRLESVTPWGHLRVHALATMLRPRTASLHTACSSCRGWVYFCLYTSYSWYSEWTFINCGYSGSILSLLTTAPRLPSKELFPPCVKPWEEGDQPFVCQGAGTKTNSFLCFYCGVPVECLTVWFILWSSLSF